MTILYRLYEVLHKLLKKKKGNKNIQRFEKGKKNMYRVLSTFWKGENLVSIILLDGSSK